MRWGEAWYIAGSGSWELAFLCFEGLARLGIWSSVLGVCVRGWERRGVGGRGGGGGKKRTEEMKWMDGWDGWDRMGWGGVG